MKIKYCFNFREIFLNFRVYGWIPNRKLKSIKFSRKKQIEILIFNFACCLRVSHDRSHETSSILVRNVLVVEEMY